MLVGLVCKLNIANVLCICICLGWFDVEAYVLLQRNTPLVLLEQENYNEHSDSDKYHLGLTKCVSPLDKLKNKISYIEGANQSRARNKLDQNNTFKQSRANRTEDKKNMTFTRLCFFCKKLAEVYDENILTFVCNSGDNFSAQHPEEKRISWL